MISNPCGKYSDGGSSGLEDRVPCSICMPFREKKETFNPYNLDSAFDED
jgi:hypothetical protein